MTPLQKCQSDHLRCLQLAGELLGGPARAADLDWELERVVRRSARRETRRFGETGRWEWPWAWEAFSTGRGDACRRPVIGFNGAMLPQHRAARPAVCAASDADPAAQAGSSPRLTIEASPEPGMLPDSSMQS